jgi:hypothetical protein
MVSLLCLPQCGQGMSIVAESSAFFMGRSFPFGGGWSFHRIGLGWPARFLGCVAGGVVCFHASSLFFCLFAVIAKASEFFATLRKGCPWIR